METPLVGGNKGGRWRRVQKTDIDILRGAATNIILVTQERLGQGGKGGKSAEENEGAARKPPRELVGDRPARCGLNQR